MKFALLTVLFVLTCTGCTGVKFADVAVNQNLPDDYKAGLAALKPGNFCKIGFQMKERFWEQEGIYGGMTTTRQPINQIWYPSHGIHSEKGVVLGAYTFGDQAKFFEK